MTQVLEVIALNDGPISEINGVREYEASQCEILEWRTAVRRRPAMYLGDVGTAGLHRLVISPVARLLEPIDGQTSQMVRISLHPDGSVVVAESGGGRRINKTELTTLQETSESQDHPSVGLAVVNALSEWFQLGWQTMGRPVHHCFRQGQPWRGRPRRVEHLGPDNFVCFFKPDPEIFGDLAISFDTLSEALNGRMSQPNSTPEIFLVDHRSGRRREFKTLDALSATSPR